MVKRDKRGEKLLHKLNWRVCFLSHFQNLLWHIRHNGLRLSENRWHIVVKHITTCRVMTRSLVYEVQIEDYPQSCSGCNSHWGWFHKLKIISSAHRRGDSGCNRLPLTSLWVLSGEVWETTKVTFCSEGMSECVSSQRSRWGRKSNNNFRENINAHLLCCSE